MSTAKVLLSFCVIYVTISITSTSKYGKVYRNNTNVSSRKWDYLTFTQTWPPASCVIWESESVKHKCNVTSAVQTWTIHGIWPSSTESDDPSFCNGSQPFDLNKIKELVPELVQFWPNVYANTVEDSLWSHEWDKHGTCAMSLPTLNTELRFFNQGLKWIKQFNMFGILQKSGISPSMDKPVLVYDIENAIQNALQVKPLLVCDTIKNNKTSYIYEIEICFDKNLNLINCPSDAAINDFPVIGAERCSTNALVWYPPIVHQFSRYHSSQTARKLKKIV